MLATPAPRTCPARAKPSWCHRCFLLALWLLGLGNLAPLQAAPSVWLPRAEGTDLRVVVWNVSKHAFFEQAADFRRVLEVLDGDLLLLDEMPGDTDATRIASVLPAPVRRWNVVYGRGGAGNSGEHGGQRSSLAAPWPLQRRAEFDAIGYPEALARDWLGRAPAGRVWQRLRDNLPWGVAVVGAEFERAGRRLLLVAFDLQCCGDPPGSWEEDRRRFEAQQIRHLIELLWASGRYHAVLAGGDLNLVAGLAPLQLLQGQRDPVLSDVPASRRHGEDDWTWDGRGTPFPSRRLDLLLVSAALRPRQSAVFDSEDLRPDERQRFGIEADLSRRLSEHRPVVVDLVWVPSEMATEIHSSASP